MKIGLGIGIPFIRNYISSLFDPSKLFTGNTNGAWYDPSDFDRYMSSLGPELVTNGGFDADISGWTAGSGSSVWVSGTAQITGSAGVVARLYQGITLTVGKWYKMTATCVSTTDSSATMEFLGGSVSTTLTTGQTKSLYFTPAATGTFYAQVRNSNSGALVSAFDNISVRELTDISTATLYQDATGTTPVTAVGQPVGLMLDKSKGLVLGPELVTNANTSTTWTTTGTNTVTQDGSAIRVTYVDSNAGALVFLTSGALSSNLTVGKWYEVTFEARVSSGGAVNIALANGTTNWSYTLTTTYQTFTGYINYTVGTPYIGRVNDGSFGAGESYWVRNISVRELPGNHAYNSSGNSANFPVLSARYNLLTKTEDFSDAAAWTVVSASISANSTTAPDGTVTADKFVPSTASSTHYVYQSVALISGVSYTISVKGKVAGYNRFMIRESTTSGLFVSFDVSTGSVVATSGASGICVVSANGFYTCTMTFVAPATTSTVMSITVLPNSGSVYADATFTGDGTSGIYIWGADLRVTNDALNQPAYQRVNTATDYDTVGFKPYLSFNGVNQWLQTNSIDFSYGDKMFVSAGVRKLSDVATGMLVEIGSGTGGNRFYVAAPLSAGNFSFNTKVTTDTEYAATGFSAPVSNVLSCAYDMAASTISSAIKPRVNAAAPTLSIIINGPPGTGNYGNYPLYIGARAGTSLWFNGRLYGLVVAGKQASASEITSCERYLNQKTGAWS